MGLPRFKWHNLVKCFDNLTSQVNGFNPLWGDKDAPRTP